ncbi:hypothetical protein ROHU_013619 [Labeo rohita]|uniref:Uncharacterized protein n=2 Tax=Labeo rohita TaxID=84645 RepID=A0A498L7F8_LABRO|nr:hypothetical protein ROHU_013619 [Labeo rohita]
MREPRLRAASMEASHRAGKREGTPAWEGSYCSCWEIKTPGIAPGGGKRHGVWPAGQGQRKANPPRRALAATAGRSRLKALHQAGGRDVEFGPLGEEGERQTRLGCLSRQLMGDQDSRRCTGRGEETWSLARQARMEKGKPAWEGSRGNCWEIKTPGIAPGGGEEMWSFAHWARREKGKPAWEGSHGN